ncbi:MULTISPECIES: DUF6221 family protein [unclassified Streptomyces]|uniref:DUF6221 family protein n=1 Tax=unclassified Streptomyces TaxID=2593676 RepID=UPI003BB4E04D
MDDLVQWLVEQLDEDERIARAVEDHSTPWAGQWVADGVNAARTFNGHVLFYGHTAPLKAGLVAHVVEHDPARVLREIEAKRQLLAAYTQTARIRDEAAARIKAAGDYPDAKDIDTWDRAEREAAILEQPVKMAASPLDHRPGYREEWRP